MKTLLEMRGVSKSFWGVQALSDVSLTVRRGEVVALLGENGAGKSTLINVASGVFTSYDGEIVIDGEPAVLHSPAQAQRLGISTIHQELNLVQTMSICDNIFLGREIGTAGWVRRRAAQREARRLLARVGLRLDPRTLVGSCPLATQQLTEVAKALSMKAKVLVMDEPTSALAEAEVRHLFDVVRALKTEGVGIVFISHRLEELAEIADTVVVLRDGHRIGQRPMREASRPELINMMVGRELTAMHDRVPREPDPEVPPILVVSDLTVTQTPTGAAVGLHHVSLDVRPGEVVGLAGLMGAGRTEILQSIFGVYPAATMRGTVIFDGRPFVVRSPSTAIRRGIAMVAEDRKAQSLILDHSVQFNATLAALRRFASAGWVRAGAERLAAADGVRRLGTRTTSIRTPVRNLSGGNQQKVVLARWLLTEPKLILLDEPTRGIDVGAKSEIYAIVADLADRGVAFLVASSELPELLGMTDRIVVISEGRVSAEFDTASATQADLMSAAMPAATGHPHPAEEAS